MSLKLYKFDAVKPYPVLASQSTARGRIDTVLAGRGEDESLYVSLQRRPDEQGDVTLVMAMPVRAVEGVVEGVEIDVISEAPGWRLFLEGGDPLGESRSFDCGAVEAMGRATCRWRGTLEPTQQAGADARQRGTMQFHRLRIVIPPELEFARFGLVCVRVLGDVRPVSAGLA